MQCLVATINTWPGFGAIDNKGMPVSTPRGSASQGLKWLGRGISRMLRSTGVAFAAIVALAIGEIGHLVMVNHRLAEQYSVLNGQRIEENKLHIGDEILGATGFDLLGRRASIATRGKVKSLIIAVSAGCPGCAASTGAFHRVAHVAAEHGLQVVFVSRDYLPDMQHSELADLPGVIISEPTYRTFNTVKLWSVPQTAVVSANGLVELVVYGALDPTKERQVVSYIAQ